MAEKSKMAAIDFHYIDNISITICISICAKEANILLSSRQTCVANFKIIDQLSTELSPFTLFIYLSKQSLCQNTFKTKHICIHVKEGNMFRMMITTHIPNFKIIEFVLAELQAFKIFKMAASNFLYMTISDNISITVFLEARNLAQTCLMGC